MIRLVVANGCSYTRGAELDDPDSQAWPAVLGRELGVPVVNLASDGGSNRRVVRTTVENLDAVLARFGVTYEQTLVIPMWTGMARTEYHHARRRDTGHRPSLPEENHWHRIGRWRIDEGDRASEAYFRLLWDEEGAISGFLVDWIGIDSFLRSRGAHVGYVYAWDVLPRRVPRSARRLAQLLDDRAVFGGDVLSSRNSFYEAVHQRFETGKLYHPLAKAHLHFGRRLAEWLHGGPLADGD
jgi:hypothetical protein